MPSLHVALLVDTPVMSSSRLRDFAVRPSGGYVDDDLQLHVIVELAVLQAFGAEQVQELAHARLADVDAPQVHLDRAVFGEEVGDLVPHAAVEVVAVDLLQILDCLLVLKTLRARREVRRAIARVARAARYARATLTVVHTWPASVRAGIRVVERRDAAAGKPSHASLRGRSAGCGRLRGPRGAPAAPSGRGSGGTQPVAYGAPKPEW